MVIKYAGKFITKMLREKKSPEEIASALAESGTTKEILEESLKNFVDPRKKKIGKEILKILGDKKIVTKKVITKNEKKSNYETADEIIKKINQKWKKK